MKLLFQRGKAVLKGKSSAETPCTELLPLPGVTPGGTDGRIHVSEHLEKGEEDRRPCWSLWGHEAPGHGLGALHTPPHQSPEQETLNKLYYHP